MRIDRRGGQAETFQVRSVPDYYGAIERQSGLATVPRYKPINGKTVAAARVNRGEHIEDGRLRLFQFRDGLCVGANAKFSVLLRNHRARLLPAAPTVFSSMMPPVRTSESGIIEANVLYHSLFESASP